MALVNLSAVEQFPDEVSWNTDDVWRPGQGILTVVALTWFMGGMWY